VCPRLSVLAELTPILGDGHLEHMSGVAGCAGPYSKISMKMFPVMNEADSTNGICDYCHLRIEDCECEITCQKCEDGLPRKHKCTKEPTHCEYCGEPIEDCHCQPSNHYD
jgi:hypothetical protein